MARAKTELSDCSRSFALQLFRAYDGHISRKFLIENALYLGLEGFSTGSPLSGLHGASYFGTAGLVFCFDRDEML